MCFDYRRRARYVSGKSFVVGMALWAFLLVGMFLVDLMAKFATRTEDVTVSSYSYDIFDVSLDDEE